MLAITVINIDEVKAVFYQGWVLFFSFMKN